MLKNTRFWTTPRGGQGGLGTPWDHWAALGGKNVEKCKVFGHPKGGQGGEGAPWDQWAALGWPKMMKNTRFLATPRAAKVA